MSFIPVFAAEKEAGLADLIRESTTLSYVTVPEICTAHVIDEKAIARLARSVAAMGRAKANHDSLDLHYLKTILVSTGWNKNDDIFDRVEAWMARATPVDKPFNYEHTCSDIIGHIVGQYVIDDESKATIADDTVVDDLPAKFHIVTPSVLYKVWAKEDLQERMDTIIAEIAEGKWFVSMECLFSGFDYGLKSANGACRLIARNQSTAFLTKHLRAYGGDGKYNGERIGRVLRNIVFSGKGLVRKPANPESVILTAAEASEAFAAQIENSFGENIAPTLDAVYSPNDKAAAQVAPKNSTEEQPTLSEESEKMAGELEALAKEVAELKTQKASLEAQLRDNDVKQVQAKLDEATQALAAKDAEIQKLTEDKTKADEAVKAATNEVTATKASLTEVEKKATEAQAKLDAIAAEQKKASRLAQVKAALKVDETKEDAVANAVAFADSLAALSDEAFAKHVEAVAKVTSLPTAPASTPAPTAPKATSVPTGTTASATEAVLETAVAEKDAALSTETVDTGVSDVQKAIAAFCGCDTEDK